MTGTTVSYEHAVPYSVRSGAHGHRSRVAYCPLFKRTADNRRGNGFRPILPGNLGQQMSKDVIDIPEGRYLDCHLEQYMERMKEKHAVDLSPDAI